MFMCVCVYAHSESQRTTLTILFSPSVVWIPRIEFIGRPPVLAMTSAFTCWVTSVALITGPSEFLWAC